MNMPQKEYFKVIESKYIQENKILNTNDINFGKRILAYPYEKLESFIRKIYELDDTYRIGLNLYIELTYQLIKYGLNLYTKFKNNLNYYQMLSNQFRDDYLGLYIQLSHDTINGKDDEDLLFNLIENNSDKFFIMLENEYGKIIDISKFTGANNKNSIDITELKIIYQELKTTINSKILVNEIGTYLSEYIFEEVRKKNFSDKISRLDSYFIFKDKLLCNYFKKRWKKYNYNHEIVKIIPENVDNYFEGDIKHIDDIENHITVCEYINIANKYWNCEHTNNPIIETFFQGTFKMERI